MEVGGGETKFVRFPLPKMKMTPATMTRAPVLMMVRRFWRLAPARTPMILTAARKTMNTTETALMARGDILKKTGR